MRQQWGRTLSVGRAPCGSALQTPESLRPQPSSCHAGAPGRGPGLTPRGRRQVCVAQSCRELRVQASWMRVLHRPRECGFWVGCWVHVWFFQGSANPFQSGRAIFTFPPAASSRRCDKAPHTGWPKPQDFIFSVPEARSPRPRCGRCCRLPGSPACRRSAFPWQQRPSAASSYPSHPPRALCSHTAMGGLGLSTRSLGDTVEPVTE